MEWQDAAISFGTLLTVVSSLPSIFSSHKPSKYTSVLAFVAITIFATTYLTVGYYGSAALNAVAALLWLGLFIQEVRIERAFKLCTIPQLHEEQK